MSGGHACPDLSRDAHCNHSAASALLKIMFSVLRLLVHRTRLKLKDLFASTFTALLGEILFRYLVYTAV